MTSRLWLAAFQWNKLVLPVAIQPWAMGSAANTSAKVVAETWEQTRSAPASASAREPIFFIADLPIVHAEARTGYDLETSAESEESVAKQRRLHPPAKRRMKAFSESARKQFDAAGLILLFDGEVSRRAGLTRTAKPVS